jgi:hypothetical protein
VITSFKKTYAGQSTQSIVVQVGDDEKLVLSQRPLRAPDQKENKFAAKVVWSKFHQGKTLGNGQYGNVHRKFRTLKQAQDFVFRNPDAAGIVFTNKRYEIRTSHILQSGSSSDCAWINRVAVPVVVGNEILDKRLCTRIAALTIIDEMLLKKRGTAPSFWGMEQKIQESKSAVVALQNERKEIDLGVAHLRNAVVTAQDVYEEKMSFPRAHREYRKRVLLDTYTHNSNAVNKQMTMLRHNKKSWEKELKLVPTKSSNKKIRLSGMNSNSATEHKTWMVTYNGYVNCRSSASLTSSTIRATMKRLETFVELDRKGDWIKHAKGWTLITYKSKRKSLAVRVDKYKRPIPAAKLRAEMKHQSAPSAETSKSHKAALQFKIADATKQLLRLSQHVKSLKQIHTSETAALDAHFDRLHKRYDAAVQHAIKRRDKGKNVFATIDKKIAAATDALLSMPTVSTKHNSIYITDFSSTKKGAVRHRTSSTL